MDRLLGWNAGSSDYPNPKIEYDATANRISRKVDNIWSSSLFHNYSYHSSSGNALNYITNWSSPAQAVTYTDFKKVKSLSQEGESFSLDYGVDDQRVFMKENSRYGVDRYYVGDYEEEISEGGRYTTGIYYIYGGNGIAGVYKNMGTSKIYYSAYTDRQGSLVALVNGKSVAQRYSYDPWGNRLQKDDAVTGFIVSRGYTMHEHLDNYRLINMNGRMYDPLSSTFLSPDPYIQSSGNWLNYNRYAYCMNNPMKYIDPSGEFVEFIIGGILIGAYIGASIKGGSFNPAKWEGCWWQGAIWGGLIGAATGGLIGAMWESGASIQTLGLKPINLLTFSPASASIGGTTTMTIGGGLGLWGGISVPLGKKKDANSTLASDYSSIDEIQNVIGTNQPGHTGDTDDSFRFPELDNSIQSGLGVLEYYSYKQKYDIPYKGLSYLSYPLGFSSMYNNYKDALYNKTSWGNFIYEGTKIILPQIWRPGTLIVPIIEGYEFVWEQFK